MESWNKALVREDLRVHDVIKVINDTGLRIAFVVDENNVLLGTVTDGDVRRALIKNMPLDIQVSEVMNKQPKTVLVGENQTRVEEKLKKHDLLHIPVVNKNGVLVDVQSALKTSKHLIDNPVLLMAGGLGLRLRPLTENCPKPMLKIGDKPILENIIDRFIEYGFHNFYITTHYLPEIIENYFGDGSAKGVNITYLREDEPLSTAGALGLLPSDMPDLPIIMMNSDLLTNINFRDFLLYHDEHKAAITVCVGEYTYKIPYGAVKTDGTYRVARLVEKPTQKHLINAGIYIVEPSIAKTIGYKKKLDMPTLIDQQMMNGKLVAMFPLHEKWTDIGNMDDFKRAQMEHEKHIKPKKTA